MGEEEVLLILLDHSQRLYLIKVGASLLESLSLLLISSLAQEVHLGVAESAGILCVGDHLLKLRAAVRRAADSSVDILADYAVVMLLGVLVAVAQLALYALLRLLVGGVAGIYDDVIHDNITYDKPRSLSGANLLRMAVATGRITLTDEIVTAAGVAAFILGLDFGAGRAARQVEFHRAFI